MKMRLARAYWPSAFLPECLVACVLSGVGIALASAIGSGGTVLRWEIWMKAIVSGAWGIHEVSHVNGLANGIEHTYIYSE